MADNTFRFVLDSTYEESERVPDFVENMQGEADLNDDETSTLMLLLSEAVTNAIKHGNQEDETKKVIVEIEVSPDSIVSTVKDEGEGFDPASTKNPLKEENLLDSTGRGVFLINELSDSSEYLDNGTKIKFTINRK